MCLGQSLLFIQAWPSSANMTHLDKDHLWAGFSHRAPDPASTWHPSARHLYMSLSAQVCNAGTACISPSVL
ncbi:hypothetical protein FB451DRAFT_131124 [Mycena latifolia]|nr:hypothetical protein FB451DRAFT_131124 [Mycena latifolia]